MKKCNNCGYPGLEDDEIKCKCGAVKINEITKTPFYVIMFEVALITLLEVAFFTVAYLIFNPYFSVSTSANFDFQIYSIMILYIIQCAIYGYYSNLAIKKASSDPTLRTTTFSSVEKRHIKKAKSTGGTCSIPPTQSNSNNNDNLLTGIIIGSVLSDHHSHDSDYSSNNNCSCSDSGSD